MRYKTFPSSEFKSRRNELVKRMEKGSLAVFFSADEYPRNGDQDHPFRQNSDMYYFSGIEQPKTILILCPDHSNEEFKEVLFVNEVNDHDAVWFGAGLSNDQVSHISGVESVKSLADYAVMLMEIMEGASSVYLWTNEYVGYHTEVPYREQRQAEEVRNLYPTHAYERLAPLCMELRLVKSDSEIERMKEAVSITKKAYDWTLKNLQSESMEYEIEAGLTYQFVKNGAQGHAYAPIVASGRNACVLHYIENDSVCKDGDLLLMDFGAELGNYAADCSRTLPVNGHFSDKQKLYYNAVLDVYKRAHKLYVPGNSIEIVNAQVGKWMEEKMIEVGLLNAEEVANQPEDAPLYKRYFMHGTSHFIGLDVHDVGTKQTVFKKGMVLTCEPGLYIPEENIGIRIETDIVVDENPIDLMADFPVEVEEIEAAMK